MSFSNKGIYNQKINIWAPKSGNYKIVNTFKDILWCRPAAEERSMMWPSHDAMYITFHARGADLKLFVMHKTPKYFPVYWLDNKSEI